MVELSPYQRKRRSALSTDVWPFVYRLIPALHVGFGLSVLKSDDCMKVITDNMCQKWEESSQVEYIHHKPFNNVSKLKIFKVQISNI